MSFAGTGRGWIAPSGEFYAFNQLGMSHPGWVKQNREVLLKHHERLPSGASAGALSDWMLRKGWVRKVHKNQYHVEEPAHVPAVVQHARQHHPDVRHLDLTVGMGKGLDAVGEPEHSFVLPLTIGSVPSTRRELQPFKRPAEQDVPDEYNVTETVADELINEVLGIPRRGGTPSRSWIDPQGRVYPLRGAFQPSGMTTYHPQWVGKHMDLVDPRLHATTGVFRKKFDIMGTMRNMLLAGWIRKASPVVYDAGAGHFDRVVRHFRTNHQDRESALVTIHHPGDRKVKYTVRHV